MQNPYSDFWSQRIKFKSQQPGGQFRVTFVGLAMPYQTVLK